MKVLFAGGGTAGHINPAIAIAKAVLARKPGSAVRFVGAPGGMEKDLVEKEGFEIRFVDIRGFKRKLCLYNFGSLRRVFTSKREADAVVDEFQPDVVVGTGGYVSWPVVRSACKKGIPTAIVEPNAVPGVSNRSLEKFADRILLGFPEAAAYFKDASKLVTVGTQIRPDFLTLRRDEARKQLGIDRPYVVSVGGSLGSRRFNEIFCDFIAEYSSRAPIRHTHVTGSYGWKWVPDLLREKGVDIENCPSLDLVQYLYDMPLRMAAADLVICRCGASTLSEIEALGKPAILIPSPNVTNNHQFHNAKALADKGAAVLMEEKDLTGAGLAAAVQELLDDPARLAGISAKASGLAVLDSAERVYAVVEGLASGKIKREGR